MSVFNFPFDVVIVNILSLLNLFSSFLVYMSSISHKLLAYRMQIHRLKNYTLRQLILSVSHLDLEYDTKYRAVRCECLCLKRSEIDP